MKNRFSQSTDNPRRTFNRDLIAKAGLSRLEAYASVRNLLTLTSWSGLDPEFVSRGSVQRAIPQTRQLILESGPVFNYKKCY